MNYIIYTDMDGTLLNHHNYNFDEAKDMLEYIKSKNIPLILTTSKTRTEILWWQKKLGIQEPFISENGAAIFFPDKYRNFDLNSYPLQDGFRIVALGKPYKFVINYLNTIKDKYKIKGFSSMNIQEIEELTNLDTKSANMAKKRDFTEPFITKEIELMPILNEEASLYGLQITQGGRFFHCIGKMQDKGKALQSATAIFRRNGYEAKTIALGDGKNDESMLKVADIAVIIPNHDGLHVKMDIKNAIKAKHKASKGWANSLQQIICN